MYHKINFIQIDEIPCSHFSWVKLALSLGWTLNIPCYHSTHAAACLSNPVRTHLGTSVMERFFIHTIRYNQFSQYCILNSPLFFLQKCAMTLFCWLSKQAWVCFLILYSVSLTQCLSCDHFALHCYHCIRSASACLNPLSYFHSFIKSINIDFTYTMC